LMRRSFIAGSELTYDERLRLGEDYVFYAQALLRGARFMLIPACGYIAVEHPGSLSHRHGAAELAALVEADNRLIEEARCRAPETVRVLKAHRSSERRKLDYRLMLDAKKQRDWPRVAMHLLRTPATAAYILNHTLRAKVTSGLGEL
jgi:succinoglycan biosynthesis protein ExoU